FAMVFLRLRGLVDPSPARPKGRGRTPWPAASWSFNLHDGNGVPLLPGLRRCALGWRIGNSPAKIGAAARRTGEDTMRFKDKGVLVTGGASGIGEQVALAMGREGAVVAVADRDAGGAGRVAEAVRQAGGKAHSFELDVTNEGAVAGFVEAAVRKLGRLDVLVNSAGVREIVSVLELPLAEWQRVIDINLTGTF